MPHMHLRGKDMTFRLIYPDGREENVLSARFNFNWQLGYEVEETHQSAQGHEDDRDRAPRQLREQSHATRPR